jgi:hypothetical protein
VSLARTRKGRFHPFADAFSRQARRFDEFMVAVSPHLETLSNPKGISADISM